MMMEKIL